MHGTRREQRGFIGKGVLTSCAETVQSVLEMRQ